ncbi:MAG: DNA recombination protein RmuC, partial [Verrucomicrobiota bacterium]|nr:DNA recombination protein RmuC [Verrucomicrobiota bacterium]
MPPLPPLVYYAIVGVASCLLGIGITWLLSRQKSALAVADCETAMNRQITEISLSLAAAQEKGSRIPEMELAAAAAQREMQILREQQSRATARMATMETQLANERKATSEKLGVLEDAQKRFSDAFKALSAEALQQNNSSFLELAKTTLEKTQQSASSDLEKRQTAIDELIKPMLQSLEKVDTKINELEKARSGAYEGLKTTVQALADTQTHLRSETTNLVRALRSPSVRGRWGEIQLKRVVELAGMVAHCDFYEQPTLHTEDGKLRPDLIVHPPGGKTIVVDAKTPLNAYLEALEA